MVNITNNKNEIQSYMPLDTSIAKLAKRECIPA